MKLLLHTCCGPCLLYPLRILRNQDCEITGYFFNPNIHPYTEFKKRLNSLVSVSEDLAVPLILDRNYGLVAFTQKVAFNEEKRCSICYDMRLNETALLAKNEGFTHFSTTLLYSRFQKHELIKDKCQRLSEKYGVEFLYHDFRRGWQAGIEESIDRSLYRQPYCGCMYSEQERYDSRLKKMLRKKRKEKGSKES